VGQADPTDPTDMPDQDYDNDNDDENTNEHWFS
jgi:hypothetical protein